MTTTTRRDAQTARELLPWMIYPSVMIAAIVSHLVLVETSMETWLATYLPVIAGAAAIAALEHRFPYRQDWRPRWPEVRTDLVYMLLVQVILPRILAAGAVYLVLQYAAIPRTGPWVHDWPVGAQVALMLIVAEFMRYWIHRLAHHWSPLWRLHAVHHSPDGLYWLNTGRFHPIEKTLQFMFDALPFIYLGVGDRVVALYFVFYAINGFFQHSNIRLRFGILNHVISTAELHRWHHSRDIRESGTNFGNNLIIWDTVFGSRYLPRHREVGRLGLFNPDYPRTLRGQLAAPFTAGIDKIDIPLLKAAEIRRNLLVQSAMLYIRLTRHRTFMSALSAPETAQQACLSAIVRNNSATDFGRRHGFRHIRNYQDWIERVEIHTYDSLRPYIERQLDGTPALSMANPIYYAATSGTTGTPKLIPVTADTLRRLQRTLAVVASIQNRARRHCLSGTLLAIPGPYREGAIGRDTAYGAISGLIYRTMPATMRAKYLLPEAILSIPDHELKHRLIVRMALQHKNITYMVSANPSTFLKLAATMNAQFDRFCQDIETGGFNDIHSLEPRTRKAIADRLSADPERADELRAIASGRKGRPVEYADVWPHLKMVVTWTGGSCGLAVDRLKATLPAGTRIFELGYMASELYATIPLEDSGNSGLPTLNDHFFEFIESQRYEAGHRETVRLHELETGKTYYVIVTTPSGLYRYFMNDIVEVTGWWSRTPLIRFVRKGRGVTNITGEKLSEEQWIEATEQVTKALGLHCPFHIALARPRRFDYLAYMEIVPRPSDKTLDRIAGMLDHSLKHLNPEYRCKRESGRLEPLTVACLADGTGEAFKAHCIGSGQRESQYKPVLLAYEDDCDFSFDRHCLSTSRHATR